MSKMEAISLLWDIKKEIDRDAERFRASLKLASQEKDPERDRYRVECAEKAERQSRALEMAGKAMTR